MFDIQGSSLKRTLTNSGIAAVAVVASLLLRQGLTRYVGPGLGPFITFYPSVMLVALLVGLWPGILATAMAALAAAYWIFPPEGILVTAPSDIAGLGLFSCMGVFMSVVAELYRRSRTEVVAYEKELALRESEARFRSLFDLLPVGAVLVNPEDAKFAFFNDTAARNLGYSPEEFATVSIPQIEAIQDEAQIRENIAKLLAGERLTFDTQHFTKSGEPRDVWVGTQRVEIGGQPKLLAVFVDITDRKRAEEAVEQRTVELEQLTQTLEQRVQRRTAELAKANEALRHLSSRLLSAHEEERKRVAGDLHDTIGSCLSGIKFKVEDTLRQMRGPAHDASKSLTAIIPEIQEGIEECRRIQMDLRPSILDDLGLLAALSWFCRRYQTLYSGIQIEQEIGVREEDVPNALRIVIFRVTQEAMNNVAKHSRARLVCVSLKKVDARLELVLEDNGQGFDLEEALGRERARRGLGLSGMRERVELSEGSFAIESTKGKGTTIRAWWSSGGDG